MILDRLFGGYLKKRADEKLSAAVDQRMKEMLPAAVAGRLSAASISLDNEMGWRLLNGKSTRELLIATYEQQIINAYWLYKTNPLAGFLIDTPASFIAADAFPYECENSDVTDILTSFWDRNRLELRWGNYIKELMVFGNLVLTAHVGEQTGRVKLGYLDPGLIETTISDPEDVQTKIGVKIKATEKHRERILRVILDSDTEEDLSLEAQSLREQMTDGECFLLQLNCMSSEMMGTSDLFNISEHLDSYEQTMIDAGEKHSQFNAFYYDIEVAGADAKKLEEERKLYTPPRTGGAFIHNEKVKSTPVSPNLQALDAETATRFQRRHILGSKNVPNHWYADPDGSNRSTADAMDRPTIKNFTRRQNEAKAVLRTIADFVISSAINAAYLRVPEEEAYKYTISTPPLTDKDVSKLSTMLRDVSSSLVVAQTQGWIDQQKAARMFSFCASMIGYEYDSDECSKIPPEGVDYTTGKNAPGEAGTSVNNSETGSKAYKPR